MEKRPALGKGLSALIPDAPEPGTSPTEVEVDRLTPNAFQPRSHVDDEPLEELARSIKANGVIQPIVVRRTGDRFQIIAGERRWRAAKLAGLLRVPIAIKEIQPGQEKSLLEMALIENIQREDLNPIETAHAYERLSRELGLSHEEIGRRTGKDRTSITNIVRLLKLPKEVQLLVAEHRLTMGHARAILGLPEATTQIQIAEKAAAQNLSVRQVEALVQELTAQRPREGSANRKEPSLDPNVKAAIEELERALGTRVRIVELSEQRGRIEIEYYSQAELERLFQHITGTK